MTASSNFKLTQGVLTVNGVSPSCATYEIEIADTEFESSAQGWARVLAYTRYGRLSMGAPHTHKNLELARVPKARRA